MVGQYGFCHSLLDELPEFDERSLEAVRQRVLSARENASVRRKLYVI